MQLFLNLSYSLDVLNEIVTCVQIKSAFDIQHFQYPPLNLPAAAIERYYQLPQALQRRYQCQKLRDYLYGIYFSHEQDLAADRASDEVGDEASDENRPLKNDSMRGINRTFYGQIQATNQGKGYFDEGWQVIGLSPNHLMVQKQGLTVQIKPNFHLRPSDRAAQIGETVAVRLPKNRLENGFYVAVGDAGLVPETASSVEIYFHVSPTGAMALMQWLTQALNPRQIAFAFKILYDPIDYGRYDAGKLRLERHRYPEAAPLLKQIYQQTQAEFGSTVPLFTKSLLPGLGLAEVPKTEPQDFGLHRCQLVAQGLLAAWDTGKETPEQRLNCICQQFAQNQIDPQFLYLNPGSTDIYPPFD
jgi:hypothetical protein